LDENILLEMERLSHCYNRKPRNATAS